MHEGTKEVVGFNGGHDDRIKQSVTERRFLNQRSLSENKSKIFVK